MGGFEGGDEGGFWDIDSIADLVDNQHVEIKKKKSNIYITDSIYSIKAYAYDTISFVPCECETFSIEGHDEIPLASNSIYKAYKVLCEYTDDSDIVDFFHEHKVVVNKAIPYKSELGESASDAAAFVSLVKEVCNLVLREDELAKIVKN